MPGDGRDSKRVFAVPVGRARAIRQQPQRVLGFPVTMFAHVDTEFFRGFVHPARAFRRWSRRRRLGAYAVDDDRASR
jgi:hypothetical protein